MKYMIIRLDLNRISLGSYGMTTYYGRRRWHIVSLEVGRCPSPAAKESRNEAVFISLDFMRVIGPEPGEVD